MQESPKTDRQNRIEELQARCLKETRESLSRTVQSLTSTVQTLSSKLSAAVVELHRLRSQGIFVTLPDEKESGFSGSLGCRQPLDEIPEEMLECPNTECSGTNLHLTYVSGAHTGYQVYCRNCFLVGPLGANRFEAVRLWNDVLERVPPTIED